MIIRKLQSQDDTAWDSYVLSHSQGMAYQLTAWKNAVKKAYQFDDCYLIAQENTDVQSKVLGILPLIHHQIPFFKKELIALPFCDAGGPLADSKEIEHALVKEAFSKAKEFGIKQLTFRNSNPFGLVPPEITLNPDKVRMVLDLPKTSDDLMASFKSKLRSQVRKPLKDGLMADVGSVELVDAFYPLFSENMRDLGSPVHSRIWVESILEEYGKYARLVVVRLKDGTPAAGGIILYHPHQVSVPWASSLRRFNRMNPNMLLYWTFLETAIQMGAEQFDFGRSTPGEGTYRFKKQWGAGQFPLHWSQYNADAILSENIQNNTFKRKSSGGIGRKCIQMIIERTPLSVSTGFGSCVRKYITL